MDTKMKLLLLGLFLALAIPMSYSWGQISEYDWTRKEVSAIISMTAEFLKDMDMKMRDVRRVERYYYGTHDFGAGRIFSQIGMTFDHMVSLYKNTSDINRIILSDWGDSIRANVIGSLQFMLGDYMELLSLIELFKERYSFWQTNNAKSKLRDIVMRFLLTHDVKPYNYEEIMSCASVAIAQGDEKDEVNKTTTTTTLSPIQPFLDMRKKQVTKDADILIKMTMDFLKDMKLKMNVIKRVEKVYDKSADFTTGTVFSDIHKRFKHMCDMYKEFATVRRYVLGHELNDTFQPNPDVVIIYQFMLSDYNEILMMLDLFHLEQNAWKEGVDSANSRVLISKQMEKFGNIPDVASPPPVEEVGVSDNANKGLEEDAKHDKAAARHRQGRRKPTEKWRVKADKNTARRWSGELDGVGFDDRKK